LRPRELVVRMKYNTRGGIDAFTEISLSKNPPDSVPLEH
jgi:hypothetical protein